NQMAHVLIEAGVGAGDRVALMLRNGNEYLEAMLASFKLRAIPVNVNTRYTVDELAYLLGDAEPLVVVHEADRTSIIEGAISAAGIQEPIRITRGDDLEDRLRSASSQRPVVTGRSGDDHYILYTGGTTGDPKGVVWRHEDLLFAALAGGNLDGEPITGPSEVAMNAVHGRTRILPASPFTHGTAHWMALAALLSGGTVLIDTGDTFDAQRLWDLVEREDVRSLVI